MSCRRKIQQQQQQQVNEEQTTTAGAISATLCVPSTSYVPATPPRTPTTPRTPATPGSSTISGTKPPGSANFPSAAFVFPPDLDASGTQPNAAPSISAIPSSSHADRRLSPASFITISPLPVVQSAVSISPASASRFGSFALPNNPDEDGDQLDRQSANTNRRPWHRVPLSCLGAGQLLLGLCLCCVDALSNPLSQSRFCISASMLAVACAVLCFVSASRWPDRSALWLLLPVCPCSGLLWACLCAESAHRLVQSPAANFKHCPSPMPKLNLNWLETERLGQLRPCLGWALNSLLMCAALVGVFLSLCSLLVCCRSLRPSSASCHTPPLAFTARRPFSMFITPAGRTRPKPIQLPLIRSNGTVMTGKWAAANSVATKREQSEEGQ